MSEVFNMIIKQYLNLRFRRIEKFISYPQITQDKIFQEILSLAKKCQFGRKFGLADIKDSDSFKKRVPLHHYDEYASDIKKMMLGEKDILYPGKIKWFSKSSGTSSDKSKFIPVSKNYLLDCHMKSSWDVVTILYHHNPTIKVFAGKNLIMGGSLETYKPNHDTRFGDISGIMVENMPAVGRPFYSPDFETALLPNWDEKIERMTKICSQQDIIMFGGVPTWVIVLFESILEYTGKSTISEVWPNVSAYIHGGVNFLPYKEQLKKYIPKDDFNFLEVYNASEGYFAIQDELDRDDMLLLLDNGIYYEFIPFDEIDDPFPSSFSINEVTLNTIYSMVISNTSGLYRYIIGDTITFTSIHPYRIKIVGRNKQCINVFGEELMVSNTDEALSLTAKKFNVSIVDYTVAPIFLTSTNKGGHEWIIEFKNPQIDKEKFALALDSALQNINSDYEAKRFKGMALENLKLNIAPKGTFEKWMRNKNKFGGQHKVPRLSSNRKNVENILALIKEN